MTQAEIDFSPPSPEIPDPPAEYIRPARRNNPRCEDLRRKAMRWIEENPRVMEIFLRLAREKLLRRERISIGDLTEDVRRLMGADPDRRGYRINNNFRAYIARWLFVQEPGIRPLIEFRRTSW